MILSYIRKNQARRLIYPILLLAVSIFLVWRSPVTDYVRMKTLDNGTVVTSAVARHTLYASVSTQTLYYTGQDCWKGGSLIGHYYYELVDGTCHIYLIRAAAGYPAQELLENQTVIGRLDSFDVEQLQDITEQLASVIGWDSVSLAGATQKYYVNQTAYLNTREILLMIVLVTVFIVSLFIIIKTLIYIVDPRLTPTYRSLYRYGRADKLMRDVEKQVNKSTLLQTKHLILTPGYIVELSEDVSAIIPLKAVLWIYDHASMRYGIHGKHLSYTLHVVTDRGDEYTLKGKSHKEVEAIYHELTTRYPNYFFGYSREHEDMAAYLVKESKKERKAGVR